MVDGAVAHYYQEFDEHSRLNNAYGQLEFVRTMDILLRHLPPAPAVVLDIGGGTGPYSETLGQWGYETHLLDAMEKHVKVARARAGIRSAVVGDARELKWPERSADVVLLLGPLYHLIDAADRRAALSEARRVLKPGGLLAAAAISRFASLFDGLARGFIYDPRFQSILIEDLESGNHFNTTGNIDFFTTAHFHRPDEIVDEVRGAGFNDVEIFAIEGPGWLDPNLETSWADRAKRGLLLDALQRVDQETSILGTSAHLLVCASA